MCIYRCGPNTALYVYKVNAFCLGCSRALTNNSKVFFWLGINGSVFIHWTVADTLTYTRIPKMLASFKPSLVI